MTRPNAACVLLLLATLLFPVGTAVRADSVIGLGITGPYPMEFVAEQDVGQLEGYVRVINDGGTTTGFYNVSVEGALASLPGWSVTAAPQAFLLDPGQSTKVAVTIACPSLMGEYAGGLRVSAYTSDNGSVGTGVAEIFVPIHVRLTPIGLVTHTDDRQVVAHITRPEVFTASNPALIDATQVAHCLLAITAIDAPCTITVANVSDLPTDRVPSTTRFHVSGRYLAITVNTSVTLTATLRVYYDGSDLDDAALEDALRLYRWDGAWQPVPSQVDAAEKSVWATIDQLSDWTVMAEVTAPLYLQWWVWALALVVLVGGALAVRWRGRLP